MFKNIASIASLVIIALCYFFVPFEGLDPTNKASLCIFFGALALWIFQPLPEYLTSLIVAAILLIVVKLPASKVFGGFSTDTWWLAVFAVILGTTINHIGLGRRMSYYFLSIFGKTNLRILYATTMVNNILAPFTPSTMARGGILAAVCESISNSMGYKPGEYKGDHTIMLANMYVTGSNTFMFLTATGANILAVRLIANVTGQTVTWMEWFLAGFIPGLPLLLLLPWVTLKMFPMQTLSQTDVAAEARARLQEMGPITGPEIRTACIMIFVLGLWVTQSLHGLSATNAGMFLTLLLVPRIGAVSLKDINSKIPWGMLLWLGMSFGLADLITKQGGFKWIVDTIFSQSTFFQSIDFMTFMLVITLGTLFIHIIFNGMTAMMFLLVPITTTLALQKGFDAYAVGLVTSMAISVGAFFLPFNAAHNLLFYSTGRYSVQQQLRGAIPLVLIAMVCLLGGLFIWWPLVGIIK